jgi:DNA-binding NtrC family response regulator
MELFVFRFEPDQTPECVVHGLPEWGGSMAAESDGSAVLVIDDDRVLADTLAEILRKHGYKPVALYSGEEALELAERFRPDVVLSDIRMSRLDGIEAGRRIQALHPDCRVILFTAQTVSTAMRQAIHGLGFELLQRPLRPEDVLTALGRKS